MNTRYKYGDIVAIDFPFSDITQTKIRPGLILLQEKTDCLVAMLGSNVARALPEDMVIVPDNENNLKVVSFLKIIKINYLHCKLIRGHIGHLSSKDKAAIKKKYINFFMKLV